MNPDTDCPICFESYTDAAECVPCLTPCCNQGLCLQCKECLQCCPFCRERWADVDDDDGGTWLREGYENPILRAARFCGRHPVLTLVGAQLTYDAGSAVSATMLAEVSPFVVGGVAVGLAAVAGGVAYHAASRRYEHQSNRLIEIIRSRGQRQVVSATSHTAALELFQAIRSNLAPQKQGMPHVYHGSIWREEARKMHLSQIQQVCAEAPRSHVATPVDKLWGDLAFCFTLWLDYSPITAKWGTCASYGRPPYGVCWHNRWREDLRHALSDLTRHLRSEQTIPPNSIPTTEMSRAFCLLATLDHILSWNVSSPGFGFSDLVQASWYRYSDFSDKLLQQFVGAWAVTPAIQGGIDFSEYDAMIDVSSHIEKMAARDIPDKFRNVW